MIKRILREPLFYLLPLLAAMYLITIPARMEFSDAKITRNGNMENIEFPYLTNMEENEIFIISFNLSLKNKFAKFNVTPDDCIQEILINGEKFPLDGIRGLCDYSKGVYLDFSKYVQKGLNHFELRMKNHGGPAGLRVEPASYNGFKSLSLIHYIFTLILLLSAAFILRKFKFKLIAIFIILLGIAVRLVAYSYMGPMQNPFDVAAHLEYAHIISEEKRLPKSDECWSCFQPPSYYIASAALKKVASFYTPDLADRILQQGQLLLSFASIIFGVAFIINLFGNCRFAYLAALVPVLWPGFVFAAPRIGNDIPFYFGTLFCMLFAQRYWNWNRNSDMLLASIGAALSLAAKSTGLVVLSAWVIVYIVSALRFLKIGSLRALFASVFIIALFTVFSNYRTIVSIFEEGKMELIGNISGLNGGLKVQNTAGNYLYFDMRDYLLVPNTNAWNDLGGRQYFWNYALKSSLSLQPETPLLTSEAGRIIATALSVFALLIFVLALWGIIHANIKEFPSLLFTVFLFIAAIYLRISYPYASSNEFRYIFPVLFPIVYFSIRGVQILENSRLRKLSYISMLSFAGLSILFIAWQGV